MKYFLLAAVFLLSACDESINTRNVIFDPQVAKEMPRSMAIDVAEGFNAATTYSPKSTCNLSPDGIKHKDTSKMTPYEGTCFTARDNSNELTYVELYVTIIDSQGLDFCQMQAGHEAYGQERFEKLFNYLGTALISLGSVYCPEE